MAEPAFQMPDGPLPGTPTSAPRPKAIWENSTAEPSPVARVNSVRPISMPTKAVANTGPRSPNASGSDIDRNRPPAIRANSKKRAEVHSGSRLLNAQLEKIRTCHTARNRNPVCTAPVRA